MHSEDLKIHVVEMMLPFVMQIVAFVLLVILFLLNLSYFFPESGSLLAIPVLHLVLLLPIAALYRWTLKMSFEHLGGSIAKVLVYFAAIIVPFSTCLLSDAIRTSMSLFESIIYIVFYYFSALVVLLYACRFDLNRKMNGKDVGGSSCGRRAGKENIKRRTKEITRPLLRKLILAELAVFALFSVAVLALSVATLFLSDKTCIFYVPLLMAFVLDMLFLAWLMAKIIAARNDNFFEKIHVIKERQENETTKLLSQFDSMRSAKAIQGSLLLTMLLSPSRRTKRINESIRPAKRFFHVSTEYEIAIPDYFHGETVVVPASIQDIRELTFDLKFRDGDGHRLERLKDREAEKYVSQAIFLAIKKLCKCSDVNGRIVSDDIARRIVGANAIKAETLLRDYEKMGCDSKAFKYLAETLLHDFWRVKPIFVRIRVLSDVEKKGMIRNQTASSRTVIICVEQNIPLIRVWNTSESKWTNCGRLIQRRLTKRRKSFYFSLANAERADSYHLAFTGPEDTYYAESEIVVVNEDGAAIEAEQMTATSRCDQDQSRLYVKAGSGFYNAALSFSYEETNHRAMQTVCVSTAICLALICFTAFKYAFSSELNPYDLQVVAIFFSVMTFAGLMSVWESLNGQRSEEWVWVSASVTMAASLVGLADIIYMLVSLSGPNEFHAVLWTVLMIVEYSIFLGIAVALFHKVKLHSSFMGKVPQTRALSESDKNHNSVSDDEKTKKCFAKRRNKGEKQQKKDEATSYYEDLIGPYWADGWLIPTWVALSRSKQ